MTLSAVGRAAIYGLIVIPSIWDAARAADKPMPAPADTSSGPASTHRYACSAVRVTPEMRRAYDFVTKRMRNSEGAVYTSFKDIDSSNSVYVDGHHITSEHMGLLLLVSAAVNDRRIYDQTFTYINSRLVSRKTGLLFWAIDKKTGKPYLDPASAEPKYYNSPLDDFRVVKGLITGYECWQDQRHLDLAVSIGRALLEKSVSSERQFPAYPTGLVTNGYGWSEDTGAGETQAALVPINYADLWTMRWLADRDRRWSVIMENSIRLMLSGQIAANGQFYNSYFPDDHYSGDWEYQKSEVGEDHIAATKIKTIQSLWTAIHLVRVGEREPAKRALAFYIRKFRENGRVSEYYDISGSEPAEKYFKEVTQMAGEARIYALLARLAYYLGDRAFGDEIIATKVLTDQVHEPESPVLGYIGRSTSDAGDGDAWNVLEALLALATQNGSPVAAHVFEKLAR